MPRLPACPPKLKNFLLNFQHKFLFFECYQNVLYKPFKMIAFQDEEDDNRSEENEELLIKEEFVVKDDASASITPPARQDEPPEDPVPEDVKPDIDALVGSPVSLPAGMRTSSDSAPLTPGVSHGYAGFQGAFQQKNSCLALADPNPANGRVVPMELPAEVLDEERRRLEDRDGMELFLTDLPTNYVNQMVWRLDYRKYLRGVYRIDRNRALLIFADKDECRLAYPSICEHKIEGRPLNIDLVGKNSGDIFRRMYPVDDVTTIPTLVNSLAICIQGVLHGKTDILHKVNAMFPKAVTIHYPMVKGRRGRPVFVYFACHEDALEAFWFAKNKFLTKYPITVVFARLEPHSPSKPWPVSVKEERREQPVVEQAKVPEERKATNPAVVERHERKSTSRPRGNFQKWNHRGRDDRQAGTRNGSRSGDRRSRDIHPNPRDRRESMPVSERSGPAFRPPPSHGGECGDCVRLRDQRNFAEEQLNVANRERKAMEGQIMRLEEENGDLKKEAGKLEKEQWLLRASLDDSLKRVTAAEAEVREVQKANDEARERLNFERTSWKKRLDELDFELRRMEEYKQKSDALEKSHAKLRDYDWLDREYNRLKNENKSLTTENQSLFEQTSVLHKALAGNALPYVQYLDANQRAIQYLASTAQRYSEEVQQLRSERTKLLTGGRPERLDRPVSSTALDDAARKVAELQVTISRLEAQKRDDDHKVEMSRSLLATIASNVQTFDQCCIEIADMFAKCPLTIQTGSLQSLSRPTSQDGSEIATKSRLLRGSLRDLLSYIKTLQGKLDNRRSSDPRLDHGFGKDRSKEIDVLNDIIANKDAKIAQLELQVVMTQMRR